MWVMLMEKISYVGLEIKLFLESILLSYYIRRKEFYCFVIYNFFFVVSWYLMDFNLFVK